VIYYFLPNPKLHGGIKVGYQFTELLNSLGIPAVVVSPDAIAPQWFKSSVAVVNEQDALGRIAESDWMIFSLQDDYERLREIPGRHAFHCQGTNPAHDPTFADPDVVILTCWEQATNYVREKFSREPIEVGIAISDCFFYSGNVKYANTVACMPRRGRETIQKSAETCRDLHFFMIDNMNEYEVSTVMKTSEFFIATAQDEWFGLPALEAMAAGCVVLSLPVLGGMDYLRDGGNSIIVNPEEMPSRLLRISNDDNIQLMAHLRQNAIATACRYRLSGQKRLLRKLLKDELKIFRG
jgi:glycosyltransferase involved in cell wall biosynthesis